MKQYILLLLIITSYFRAGAQHTINGRISSAIDQKTLAGATIFIKETGLSVSAGNDGQFSIAAYGTTVTIEFSFIGYKRKIIRVNLPLTDTLQVYLDNDMAQLSEVVISTGYQQINKERVTGAFSYVDNKLFNQQVSPDIISRLPSIANSITVDRGTNGDGQIMVRGLSTIRGPKSPLIIIDNFPYDGDINNINPNIVENITILKDAAAASIWGARAGNGVIVITTKKGKYNQPITIDFNANFTIGEKPDLSYIRQMSSSDFIDVEQALYKKGFYDSQIGSADHPVLSPVVELLSGSLSPTAIQAQINNLRNIDIRDQFSKYMYQKSTAQQYFLNMQGGSQQVSWNTAAGYDKNISNLDAGYSRINFRFQNVYRPVKPLQISSGVYYTQSKNISGKPGYGGITSQSSSFFPYTQFAGSDGNPLIVVKDYEQNYKQNAGSGKLADWNYYPLTDYLHSTSTSSTSDIVVNLGVNYKVWNDLNADVKYQYERQQGDTKILNDQYSYYARNFVNRYTQVDDTGNATFIVPPGGILDMGNSLLQSNNIRGQLNFDHSWGLHNITAIAGSEVRSAHTTSDQNRLYGYNGDNLTFANVDYTRQYPDFVTGGSSFIQDNKSLGDQTTKFVSYYANAAYTYKGRYTVSASGRRDASNLFGLKTNDQWNPFWSGGASWIISDEPFYHSTLIPTLKLRATYGFSGNIDPSMVAVSTITYVPETSPYTGTPYARFNNYYNPSLRWETSKMLNIAIDFSTKNARLSGSIEYYRKNGANLFGTAQVDYTTGIGTTTLQNVASMKGNGVDVELRSLNIDKAVKWSTTLNFSYYKDQVTDYYLNFTQGSAFITGTSSFPVTGVPGKPVYSIYAYKWAGLDPQTGDPQGYLNGQVSKEYSTIIGSGTQLADLQYFGSALPTKFGSFINTISYKGLSLNFSIVYKLGYYFRRNSINYTNLFTNWQGHSDFSQRWQNQGDELTTNVPSTDFTTNSARDNFYSGSGVLVDKGDHIRLQYINLSYDINKQQWHGLPVKSLQIYANINNIGILWRANKDHIDPDFNYGQYPLVNPRTYSIGLRANFN